MIKKITQYLDHVKTRENLCANQGASAQNGEAFQEIGEAFAQTGEAIRKIGGASAQIGEPSRKWRNLSAQWVCWFLISKGKKTYAI